MDFPLRAGGTSFLRAGRGLKLCILGGAASVPGGEQGLRIERRVSDIASGVCHPLHD